MKLKTEKEKRFKILLLDMMSETSKLVLFAVVSFCIIASTFVLVGWSFGLQGAEDLFRTIIALLMFVTGFYSWKARAENIEKIKQRGVLRDETINIIAKQGDTTVSKQTQSSRSDEDAVG